MSPIDISLKLANQNPIVPPAQGFFYVDQGNYQTFMLADTPLTAYSDSATYCIITAVVSNFDNYNSLTLAHLDSPARIDQLGSRVVQCELALLQGDPRQDNRGDFGVSYSGDGRAVATNQPYDLQLYQRDPTCGGQTVYCIMRRQEQPPLQIRDAGLPFTHAELVELAEIALQFRKDPQDPSTALSNIVNLQSEEIRQNWSTTPAYDVAER